MIWVVGLVQKCWRYEVKQEDTFDSIIARAGGKALQASESDPEGPKIWPPVYARISLKNPVDGKRELSVPMRLWNEPVSRHAPLHNIAQIQFIAAY